MKHIDVTVVVPTYNCGDYISDCLSSLLNQETSYSYEIIVVDDGSTDDTKNIVTNNANKKIRYYYKMNSGVSEARNFGMKKARGDYITFVDADDNVLRGYIETLLSEEKRTNADLVVSGYTIEFLKSNERIHNLFEKNEFYVDDFAGIIKMFGSGGLLNVSVAKLYKLDIINKENIVFDGSLTTGEDFVFNLEYLNYVRNVSFLNVSNYIYERRDVISGVNSYKSDLLKMTDLCLTKLKNFYIDKGLSTELCKTILGNYYLDYISTGIYNLYRSECELKGKQKREQIKAFLALDTNEYFSNSNRNGVLSKLAKKLFINGNAYLINCIYSILFLFRNKFRNIYIKNRMRLLKDERR